MSNLVTPKCPYCGAPLQLLADVDVTDETPPPHLAAWVAGKLHAAPSTSTTGSRHLP